MMSKWYEYHQNWYKYVSSAVNETKLEGSLKIKLLVKPSVPIQRMYSLQALPSIIEGSLWIPEIKSQYAGNNGTMLLQHEHCEQWVCPALTPAAGPCDLQRSSSSCVWAHLATRDTRACHRGRCRLCLCSASENNILGRWNHICTAGRSLSLAAQPKPVRITRPTCNQPNFVSI